MSSLPIKRALITVFDKTGVVALAKTLQQFKVEIISTGGTATLLREQGITVTDIAAYTGFPEMLAGRVKTLHPKVYAGLLARLAVDDATLAEHGIPRIDLVVVNLYPFEIVTAQPNCDLANAIENIDIGGPTLIRAAAKNYAAVATVTAPSSYAHLIAELTASAGQLALTTRFQLAKQAFARVAQYDAAIANYFGCQQANGTTQLFPDTYTMQFSKKQDLRYGENPHQRAAFYLDHNAHASALAHAHQCQGKDLSYNNIADADTAWACVKSFTAPACVLVKHANPCGVASAETIHLAYQRAWATDKTSAFGGIIAFNQPVDAETASAILAQQFVEVIIAPDFTAEALAIFASKPNVRLLSCGQTTNAPATLAPNLTYQRVSGGLLVQEVDQAELSRQALKTVTQRQPSAQELADLLFSWHVVKFVKSNAVVYAKNATTLAIGAGQMSRVYSTRIAALKAQEEGLTLAGAVMASDAFFPFRDSIDLAKQMGITAIIQPGGSLRDNEVIAAADEANIAMVFTGIRHFRH